MPRSDAHAVYIRTQKGQALAMAPRALHDEQSHAVLRMVNGYTPADCLAKLSAQVIPDTFMRLQGLEKLGLVKRIDTDDWPMLPCFSAAYF